MAKRGVIIVAGGSGSRMQSAVPKQFMIVGGEPVVARAINTFSSALPGADIVVVLPEEHIAMWKNLAARFDVAVHRCVAGGSERSPTNPNLKSPHPSPSTSLNKGRHNAEPVSGSCRPSRFVGNLNFPFQRLYSSNGTPIANVLLPEHAYLRLIA